LGDARSADGIVALFRKNNVSREASRLSVVPERELEAMGVLA